MIHSIVAVAALCALSHTCSGSVLQSSCQEVFRYEPKVVAVDGQWHGTITLQRKNLRAHNQINFVFNKPILQLKILAEKVLTDNNKTFSISNPTIQENTASTTDIRFHVLYDKNETPPKLQSVLFNHRHICILNRKTRSTSDDECGMVVKDSTVPFITHSLGGTKIRNYPWHAAIYTFSENGFIYQCGGSLITKEHIITAAHCVLESQQSSRPAYPDSLIVYLGLQNRRRLRADYVQDIDVATITIHPDFNITNYHNDIAIAKLRSEVTITDHVRPICLWNRDVGLSAILNRLGNVAGWGIDENGKYGNILKHVRLPVVSEGECLRSNSDVFSKIYSVNDFCAGFGNKNETSVCNGDSGGGMAFIREETNAHTIWHLRGIVSIGVQKERTGICEPSQYVVFTDTAKYLRWIRQVLGLKRPETKQKKYAWHAAVYSVNSNNFGHSYQCGGSLITKQHIITAAHCVTKDANEYVVYFGLQKLNELGSNVQIRTVSVKNMHPNHTGFESRNDLAVLKLTSEVELTDYVHPIGLWEEDEKLSEVPNLLGSVAGWTVDETSKLNPVLQYEKFPIVSAVTCLRSNPNFFSRVFGKNDFCAGYRNGTQFCQGTSGGGFAVTRSGSDGQPVWVLGGILSLSAAKNSQCDAFQYFVFTDTTKYSSWIREQLN